VRYACSFGVVCLIGFMLSSTSEPLPCLLPDQGSLLFVGLESNYGSLLLCSLSYFGGLLVPLSQFSVNLDRVLLCESSIVF
jgi:hypothetical protein